MWQILVSKRTSPTQQQGLAWALLPWTWRVPGSSARPACSSRCRGRCTPRPPGRQRRSQRPSGTRSGPGSWSWCTLQAATGETVRKNLLNVEISPSKEAAWRGKGEVPGFSVFLSVSLSPFSKYIYKLIFPISKSLHHWAQSSNLQSVLYFSEKCPLEE